MDKPSFKLVGAPCGQHGQYTFYKALRIIGKKEKIVAIGDFFFVRIWQDSELVSIGELQLLWTDRVSDQTLVSLRLYFLPENTPDGRSQHGEHEVLAINEKVVVRADDLMSWMCAGGEWRWGLRAVWRGACAPPAAPRDTAAAAATAPLHHTRLDFSDVDKEKSAIVLDSEAPGVVVFSYPRYCRYRALLARLDGIQADWLRDSLVAALGGYAAPTSNTRILYCKDTFEYPELEGHEFVCSHLAPRLKGRGRGRRRRAPADPSHDPQRAMRDRSDSDDAPDHTEEDTTPRRLSLRNGGGGSRHSSDEAGSAREDTPEDSAFLHQLRLFYRDRNQLFKPEHTLKDLSLRALYVAVRARGGYEAVCRRQLWRALAQRQPARTRRHYERFLLPYENHERRSHLPYKLNGRLDEPHTIATIDVTDSPQHEGECSPEKILRTPSPKPEKPEIDNETGELTNKEDIISKNAEQLNQEFLDSLPKEEKSMKISVKPVEKLIEPNMVKLFDDNSALISELVAKRNTSDSSKVIDDSKDLTQGNLFLNALAQKLNLGAADTTFLKDLSRPPAAHAHAPLNGHAANTNTNTQANSLANANTNTNDPRSSRLVGTSSLRAVRVKPTRQHAPSSTPPNPLRPDSASSSPPLPLSLPPPPAPSSAPPFSSAPPSSAPFTNFGIHHPPVMTPGGHSDDEIVEVPYKPKTPEIIDLDEYPESPQAVKKKKLDILKERGLEVTALPTPAWQAPLAPLINPPIMLNPAVQHQIMTQAQLFQMYNIMPQNYSNGIQPPKVIQGSSVFGSAGPEKTVYGNPKDPFMPPPHILHGAPVKPLRSAPPSTTVPQDILDLTCKTTSPPPQKPAVEIVRLPASPSPKLSAQNLTKNYQLIDGKAVVGSNLEITLVNKTPVKNRPPQKRSSNGKFMSAKTPTPPKDKYPSPSTPKKPAINIPNYQIRDAPSPTSTQNTFKSTNLSTMSHMMDMQKSALPMTSFMDPYMALYNVAGQIDQRQLAMYRDLMANQFRGYPGLLNLGVSSTPTTKN